MNEVALDARDRCVGCGTCTRSCAFLGKYGLDFRSLDELRELAYHCFLCGRCAEVCPYDIDGRQVMLELRRERVREAGGKLDEPGYGMLVQEKARYKFRNYRHLKQAAPAAGEGTPRRVLFPGCNFPSFYPKTCKKLVALFAAHGVPAVYDCCGKPIAELGLADDEARIAAEIDAKLAEAGVEEVVMVCPNCYYFLRPLISQRVVSVYEALADYGVGAAAKAGAEGLRPVFMPCPDRADGAWREQAERACGVRFVPIDGVQCCGLGGCAAAKEPELSAGFAEAAVGGCEETVYTYCASCAGKFMRGGRDTVHVLSELLGTNEKPDVAKSLVNRAKSKFW